MADILIVAPDGFPEDRAREITHIFLKLQDTTPADVNIQTISLSELIDCLTFKVPVAIVLLDLDLREEVAIMQAVSHLAHCQDVAIMPVRYEGSFLGFEYEPRPTASEVRYVGPGIPYSRRNLSSMN